MIRISIGNVGSGKTASEVREMYMSRNKIKTYANIKTRLKTQVDIDSSMIIKKDIKDYIKRRGGNVEPVYEYKLNLDFWQSIKEPINVVIDEAHTILNSRKALTKVNVVITDWIALIRRVLGENSVGYGDLVLITQLPNRVDIICREMAHQVRYHVCHYRKTCLDCGTTWQENSDMAEGYNSCPACDSVNVRKHSHAIEIKCFQGMDMYNNYKLFGAKSYYKHYFIHDIEKYFGLYDTLQWDNMFSDVYT